MLRPVTRLMGLLLVTSFSAWADTPKVKPEHLLKVVGEEGHWVLLGREPKGILIFESRGGKAVEVPYNHEQSMVYYDGGTMDLYLNDGGRIVVPAGAQNYLNFPFPPSYIHADRAMDELQGVAVNAETLREAGFLDFIDPAFFGPKKVDRKVELPEVSAIQDAETAVLVLSSERDPHLSGDDAQEKLKKLLDANKGKLKTKSGYYYSPSVAIIDRGAVDGFLKSFKDLSDIALTVYPSFKDSLAVVKSGTPDELLEVLADEKKSFVERLQALNGIGKGKLTDYLLVAQQIREVFNGLDFVGRTIGEMVQEEISAKLYPTFHETSGANFQEIVQREIPTHPLFVNFIAPIRLAQASMLEFAHALGKRYGKEIVFMSAMTGGGVGLALIEKQTNFGFQSVNGPTTGNYLDFWLDWMLDLLKDGAERGPGPDGEKWRRSSKSGGIYQQLKVSGNNTFVYSVEPGFSGSRWHLDNLGPSPLLLLGLKTSEEASRKAIIKFLIAADRWAAVQLEKEAKAPGRQNEPPPHGNTLLFSFFNRLRYSAAEFRDYPGFDSNLYKTNAMKIFQELLVTGPDTLSTRGTNEFLIDSALDLAQEFEAGDQFTAQQKAMASSVKAIILNKLLAAMRFLDNEGSNPCAVLLSANPWSAWRKLPGRF